MQERARAEDEEDASTSDPVEEKDAVMNWSPREGIEEEDDDVLHPEGLRGKHMDVKSMEALRKRIAVRLGLGRGDREGWNCDLECVTY